MKNEKRKHSVGYFSAYYRGLECLLNMWPKIRQEVPDATLDVYYGWESWLALEGEDDFYRRMERKFEILKDQGVTVHGRVSHVDLARAMRGIQVWAYPTEFEEIFAITAIKANAAHCKPVVCGVAALKETAGPIANIIKTRKIYADEYKQQQFIDGVVSAMNTDITDDEIKLQDDFVKNFGWDNIAEEWSSVIEEKLRENDSRIPKGEKQW